MDNNKIGKFIEPRRKEIKESSNDINILKVSTFIIENCKLRLTNNYLNKYYNKEIILE